MNTEKLPKILALSLLPAVPAYFLGRLVVTLASRSQYIFLFLTNPINIAKLFIILLMLGVLAIPIFSTTSESKKRGWGALGIVNTAFAIPQIAPYPRTLVLLIISSLLFFLTLLWLKNALTRKIKNIIKIRGGGTFRTEIKYFYLGIAFVTAASFASGHTLKLQEKQQTLKVPERLLDQLAKPLAPVIEQQLGEQLENLVGQQFEQKLGISGEKEILEFLKQESGETLTEGSVRTQLGLSPEQLEKIEITEQGKIDLSGALPGATTLLQNKLENLLAKYQEYVVIFLATILFLTVHFLGRLALVFCPLLVTILLAIFRKLGIIRVTTEQVEAERFEL